MFRNLIPALADEFHLVAPDYPSYGQSSFPTKHEFDYTFERFHEIVLGFVDTVGLDTFSIYVQDYGAPIGLRIASRHPERVQALIVQSGNAYMDGFTPMWEPFSLAQSEPREEVPARGPLTYEAVKRPDARHAEPGGRPTGCSDPGRPQPQRPGNRHPTGHLL
jgi:pimeloyl-ACP methyl ester carboxylesterase